MKLNEIANTHYHQNVQTWITAAKSAVIPQINQVLTDESQQDPRWFINSRSSRLKQLVDELFTINLIKSSKNKWTIDDFEGKYHSDAISSAISELNKHASLLYQTLRSQLLFNRINKYMGVEHKE